MLSEFELIERYFTTATRHTILGVGDDAALIQPGAAMQLAISADMLVAGRHFSAQAPARSIGHKALAVNLSDMAAIGATPRWATLALALPAVDEAWLAEFARGFLDLAQSTQVDLVGGDTTRGPLNICVQILGELPVGRALLRSAAVPEDDIWVSGTLGAAALALAAARQEISLAPGALELCRQRLDWPQARVALGLALRGLAHAAIDVSDGLLADLGHVCERSQVGAVVVLESLPLEPNLRREDPVVQRCALAGGDDYELCFTAPPHRRDEIEALSGQIDLRLSRIGQMRSQPGIEVLSAGRRIDITERGFDHFR